MKLTAEPETAPTYVRGIFRWIQRLLIVIGILALGYVGFRLLEARLYQVSAKRSLESQIQQERELELSLDLKKVPHEIQPKPPIKPGDLLGRLDIPKLGLSVAVLQGTSSRMLRLGTGHIEGTPLPGEPGNSAIAGHRDTFFRELKDIQKGDEIEFQTAVGLFRYEVDWAKVVAPDDTSVLAPSTESALTLVTCYPFYFVGPAPKRFVVRAHQE
jgi:LPXTG-site transpeptidase (sortase) family protein